MRAFSDIVQDLKARPETKIVRAEDDMIVFLLQYVSPRGCRQLTVTARIHEDWEQLTVACTSGLPSWRQLEAARRLVAGQDEWMMQLHVPPEHVDIGEESALHLWRPRDAEIPLPPPEAVHSAFAAG